MDRNLKNLISEDPLMLKATGDVAKGAASIEAVTKGDVAKLKNLISEDPLMLKATAITNGNTPLHVASIEGHAHFVKEVLNLRPEFAQELNRSGLSPLQIASANGDTDTVNESHLCLIRSKEDRNPFHSAVVKGRFDVIKEFLSVYENCIVQVTARGETCFHVAVKNNQFGAFKILNEQ